MKTRMLRDAIFVAIGGTLSLGCGEKDDTATDSAAAEADADADADADTDTDTDSLSPVPEGDYPECTDATEKFGKQCCVDVYCYTPGDGVCPDSSAVSAAEVSGKSLGSGSCQCGEIEGPFANTGTGQEEACCYLIGIEGCEGRPLRVAGALRKAAAVSRADWV